MNVSTMKLDLCGVLWHAPCHTLFARRVASPLAGFSAMLRDLCIAVERSRLRLQGGGDIGKLIGPFSKVIDGVITDKFVRNWLDLLSFLLSGEAFSVHELHSDGLAWHFSCHCDSPYTQRRRLAL